MAEKKTAYLRGKGERADRIYVLLQEKIGDDYEIVRSEELLYPHDAEVELSIDGKLIVDTGHNDGIDRYLVRRHLVRLEHEKRKDQRRC